jgi:transcriptional regulator with XRE-family HTH domain
MPSLEQQVGALVRHHRERADLTQSALAELVDLQVGSISRIERGENAPSFDTLSKLAEVLKVDVRDFFGLGPFAAKDGREDPLVRLIERVSPLDVAKLDWIDSVVTAVLAKPQD